MPKPARRDLVTSTRAALRVAWLLSTAACVSGVPAKPGVDKPQPARELLGAGRCLTPPARSTPLVLDWGARERADLAEAMKGGVAIVHYDCKSLYVVAGCTLPGSYGFVGVEPQQELVQLDSADEIRVNLPAFGVSLGMEVERASTLNVAFITIGKRRTAVARATKSELRGGAACKEATHFVRGAYVGAFAMNAGVRGSVHVAADLLGGGPKAGSSASKTYRVEGEIVACGKARVDAAAPPAECASVVRLELLAISSEPTTFTSDAELSGCPDGLVWAGGKCTPSRAGVAFRCAPENPSECREQCDAGDMTSCGYFAYASQWAMYGAAKDEKLAVTLYTKACDAGVQNACTGIGVMLHRLQGGLKRDDARSVQLHRKACDAGELRGCTNLGFHYENGFGVEKDVPKAFALAKRACTGGYAMGCTNVGLYHLNGRGTAQDSQEAARYLEVGCRGGMATACNGLGRLRAVGNGVHRDPALAAKDYRDSCELEVSEEAGDGCRALGQAYLRGEGVERNSEKGLALLRKGCDYRNSQSCLELAAVHRKGELVPQSDLAANGALDDACRKGMGDACSALGDAYELGLGLGVNGARGRELCTRGCELKSAVSCARLARMCATTSPKDDRCTLAAQRGGCELGDVGACGGYGYSIETGVGTRADGPAALAVYAPHCAAGHDFSCRRVGFINYLALAGARKNALAAAPAFKKACELNDAVSCNTLGVMHLRGDGVAQSAVTAASYYDRACTLKDFAACHNLSAMYNSGTELPKDPVKGEAYAKLSCTYGNPIDCKEAWTEDVCNASLEGCTQLGNSFAKGKGLIKRDENRAFTLFKRACDGGHANGCAYLGDAYTNGCGTKADAAMAEKTYKRACALGHAAACR